MLYPRTYGSVFKSRGEQLQRENDAPRIHQVLLEVRGAAQLPSGLLASDNEKVLSIYLMHA